MTQEEKAKAYDKALNTAREILAHTSENYLCTHLTKEDIKEMYSRFFPDLKESEDEKTRKEIIYHIKNCDDTIDEETEKRMIAWLENIPYTIDKEKREGFHLGYKAALEKQGQTFTKKDVENAYLKGVSDTKHELEKQGEEKPRYSIGDVLCDKSCTTLNKESQPNFEITDIRNGMYICDKGSFPISQQDEYELVAKKMEQESTWNEDSNSIISDLLDYFDEDKCLKHEVNDIVEWLKNIKPQQKECGENEIKMLDNLITYLDSRKDLLEEIKSTYIDWLKSLKERIGG